MDSRNSIFRFLAQYLGARPVARTLSQMLQEAEIGIWARNSRKIRHAGFSKVDRPPKLLLEEEDCGEVPLLLVQRAEFLGYIRRARHLLRSRQYEAMPKFLRHVTLASSSLSRPKNFAVVSQSGRGNWWHKWYDFFSNRPLVETYLQTETHPPAQSSVDLKVLIV